MEKMPKLSNSGTVGDVFEKDLFFVVGVAKSGTTWLQRILDTSPEIVCKGESHFVNILYPAINSALDNYNAYHLSKSAPGAAWEANPTTPRFEKNDKYYLWVLAMALMFEKWLVDPNIKHVGEKTPHNVKFMHILGRVFPSARFVHIIRDGRDAAVSGWFFGRSNMDQPYELRDTLQTYVMRFAGAWKEMIEGARKAGAWLGPRYIEVRYEDLVEDPYVEVKRILEFLNADTSDNIVRACVESNRFEMLSGGRRPGEEKRDAFYRKGVPGDWRNHMNEKITQAFLAQAGELLRSLGYSEI